jgi:hypothetical protein
MAVAQAKSIVLHTLELSLHLPSNNPWHSDDHECTDPELPRSGG